MTGGLCVYIVFTLDSTHSTGNQHTNPPSPSRKWPEEIVRFSTTYASILRTGNFDPISFIFCSAPSDRQNRSTEAEEIL